MFASKNERYYDKLKKRRDEIMRTIEHVQKEQRTVDENKEWMDKTAYESRCHLLDSLADWYTNEATRIDHALTRITEGRYGIRLGVPRADRAPASGNRPRSGFLRRVPDE